LVQAGLGSELTHKLHAAVCLKMPLILMKDLQEEFEVTDGCLMRWKWFMKTSMKGNKAWLMRVQWVIILNVCL
jgi:hypothetical protein